MAKNHTSVNEDSTAPDTPELDEAVASEPAESPETESETATAEQTPSEQVQPEAVPQQLPPQDALPERDPGKTLGLVGLIVALIAGVVGIVLGVLSYRKSRAADFGGGLGMAAIIVGAITTVLLGTQLFLLANGMGIGGACDGRKPGVYELENGTVISCT